MENRRPLRAAVVRLAAAAAALLAVAAPARAGVVINEIFYHAPNDLDDLQFVELHNTGDQPVSLAGWKFTHGIRHEFPAGTTIAPGGYLVVCKSLKEFRKTVEAAMELTNVPKEFSSRYLNEGFSGGEKKRMEILQLALQQPKVAVLDETDSGLDIDALNVVANGVNTVAKESGMGVLIITHYQRILHIVQPDRVSIMYDGRIVKEGGPELVDELEAKGYGWITDEVPASA